MPDYKHVQEIARASLMADFFAVRIDEEELYSDLQSMLRALQLPETNPALEKLKVIAADAADATAFIDAVKEADLFPTMREIITRVRLA